MTPEKPSDSPDWDGKVQQWGTLREVMHGEVIDGQVRLSEAIDKPHVYGIGAPDKLHGEILIADSVAWVAIVQDGERIETRQSDTTDSAVLLAISQVPRWNEVTADDDVSAEDFDDFIQKTLSEAGLDKLETVPFLIEGQFSSLDLHVLNGQCPFAEVTVEILKQRLDDPSLAFDTVRLTFEKTYARPMQWYYRVWLRLFRDPIGKLQRTSMAKLGQREWNSVVYVGDGIWDLRAAKSLRIGFVGIASGDKAAALVKAGAKHVLPDFADTAHFFNTIEFASMVID